jgi:hypothetical protein
MKTAGSLEFFLGKTRTRGSFDSQNFQKTEIRGSSISILKIYKIL